MSGTKRAIYIALAVIVATIISFITPPEPMTKKSMIYIGLFAAFIIVLLFNAMSEFVAGLLFLAFSVLLGVADIETMFIMFSKSTTWLFVGVLSIAAAVTRAGLLNRLSYNCMKLFKPNFSGQIGALLLTGTILTPLIPSTTAKATILCPLSKGISQAMHIENNTKAGAGLFLAAFISTGVLGVGLMSGSINTITMINLMPPEAASKVTWMGYLASSFPWLIVMLLGFYLFLSKYYREGSEVKLPDNYVNQQLKEMGPMSKQEKLCAGMLALLLIMWITEPLHGIPSAMSALVIGMVMYITGLLDDKAFSQSIPWSVIVFIGVIMAISVPFKALGISEWLVNVVGPIVAPFTGNILVSVIFITILTYVLRYALVSMTVTMTVVMIIFIPLMQAHGVSPWIVGFLVLCGTQVWNLSFHNGNLIGALGSVALDGNPMTTHKDLLLGSYAFMVISLIGMLISIPLWKMLGLIL